MGANFFFQLYKITKQMRNVMFNKDTLYLLTVEYLFILCSRFEFGFFVLSRSNGLSVFILYLETVWTPKAIPLIFSVTKDYMVCQIVKYTCLHLVLIIWFYIYTWICKNIRMIWLLQFGLCFFEYVFTALLSGHCIWFSFHLYVQTSFWVVVGFLNSCMSFSVQGSYDVWEYRL